MLDRDQLRAQLHALYQRGPVERAILEILSERKKDRSQTAIKTLVNALRQRGVNVTRHLVVQSVKGIADTGAGRFVKGTHGHETRIEWIVPVTEVGRLVAEGLGSSAAEETPGTAVAKLRAQREVLLRGLALGGRISRSLLMGLDDQERLLRAEGEGNLNTLRRCLDPRSPHRRLLAVEDLAKVLSDADVLNTLTEADLDDWPEGVLEACEGAPPAVVASLAHALRVLIYAAATPPTAKLKLVRSPGDDGKTGDPG